MGMAARGTPALTSPSASDARGVGEGAGTMTGMAAGTGVVHEVGTVAGRTSLPAVRLTLVAAQDWALISARRGRRAAVGPDPFGTPVARPPAVLSLLRIGPGAASDIRGNVTKVQDRRVRDDRPWGDGDNDVFRYRAKVRAEVDG